MTNECYLMDCMDWMAELPDKAFDLGVVDPPYGENTGRKKYHGKRKGIAFTKYKQKDWDNKIPDKEYFIELFRISNNQIIFGANYFVEYLNKSSGWIFWDKLFSPDFSFAAGEFIYTSFNIAAKKIAVRVEKNCVSNNEEKAKKFSRIHQCQKPVALYKWLLQNYAKPGWTIFDSHVGSGSVRIACHDLGFDFTGCEIDPDYWQAQEERFKNHIANRELFDKQEIQDLIYQEV